ncbi:hypothetical protein PESP_a3433 [Pseudoalteromonas espejiana DSM 9414]|nr:hypothetical protein PESP_a3433 [Pseudoalteromonas espejiana DSM 9414]
MAICFAPTELELKQTANNSHFIIFTFIIFIIFLSLLSALLLHAK